MATSLTDEILTRHNRELRERCEELEERIRQLESLLSEKTPVLMWAHAYMPRGQVKLLEYLVLRDVATRVGIMNWMYGYADNAPDEKILDVYVCKLRRALRDAFPNEPDLIVTHWARGYSLTEHARRLIVSRSVDKSEIAA